MVGDEHIKAFPVGTGIYRALPANRHPAAGVPCGYRDIPSDVNDLGADISRSLWVQGYTVEAQSQLVELHAFPVGTGIYR